MKHISTILCAAVAAALVLSSCEKKGNGKLDPNAMISLRPDMDKVASAPTKADAEHLTPLEIVKQCEGIKFWNRNVRPDGPTGRGFGDHQRDTVGIRLMMFGTDIIAQNGELDLTFIGASDLVFRRVTVPYPDLTFDTIGYIPNSVMRDAERQIKTYYADKNYAAVYELFDRIFRFTPITGKEWEDLKAQGKN